MLNPLVKKKQSDISIEEAIRLASSSPQTIQKAAIEQKKRQPVPQKKPVQKKQDNIITSTLNAGKDFIQSQKERNAINESLKAKSSSEIGNQKIEKMRELVRMAGYENDPAIQGFLNESEPIVKQKAAQKNKERVDYAANLADQFQSMNGKTSNKIDLLNAQNRVDEDLLQYHPDKNSEDYKKRKQQLIEKKQIVYDRGINKAKEALGSFGKDASYLLGAGVDMLSNPQNLQYRIASGLAEKMVENNMIPASEEKKAEALANFKNLSDNLDKRIQSNSYATQALNKGYDALDRIVDENYEKKIGGNIAGSTYSEAAQTDNSIEAGVGSFIGNTLPYMTGLGEAGAGKLASRLVTKIGVKNPVAKKILEAGVSEMIQDAPISNASTIGNLTQRVATGEMTAEEALRAAPVEMLMNTATDFAMPALTKGGVGLISKGLNLTKGDPKINRAKNIQNIRQARLANEASIADPNISQSPLKVETPSAVKPADPLDPAFQEKQKILENKKYFLNSIMSRQDIQGDTTKLNEIGQQRVKNLQDDIAKLESELNPKTQEIQNAPDQQIDPLGEVPQAKKVEMPNKPGYQETAPIQPVQKTEMPATDPLDMNQQYASLQRELKATNKQLKRARGTNDLQQVQQIIKAKKEIQNKIKALESFEEKLPQKTNQDIPPVQKTEVETTPQQAKFEQPETPLKTNEVPIKTEEPEPIKVENPENKGETIEVDPRSFSLTRPPEIKSWKEFHELKRNPSNFRTVDDLAAVHGKKVPQHASQLVDDMVSKHAETKTLTATKEDLEKKIIDQMRKEGINEVVVDGKKYEIKKGSSKVYLNEEGDKLLKKMLDDEYAKGNLEYVRSEDSINIQHNYQVVPRIPKQGIAPLESKVRLLQETKASLKEATESLEESKARVKSEVLSGFDHGGLRQVFRDSKANATISVSKGADRLNDAEKPDALRKRLEEEGKLTNEQINQRVASHAEFLKKKEALRESLKEKGYKKIVESKESFGAVAKNKKAKENFLERDTKTIQSARASSDALMKDFRSGKLDDDILKEYMDDVDVMNKQFMFDPLSMGVTGAIAQKVIGGNGFIDTLELLFQVPVFENFVHNFFAKGAKGADRAKIKDFLKTAGEFVTNTPKTIDQHILSVGKEGSVLKQLNKKLVEDFQRMETDIDVINTRLSMEEDIVMKEIKDLIDKHGIDNVLDPHTGRLKPNFTHVKGADYLEQRAATLREMKEQLKEHLELLKERREPLQKKLDRANELANENKAANKERQALKKAIEEIDSTIVYLDQKAGIFAATRGSGFIEGLQSLFYKMTLGWSPSTFFMNMTDYINIRSSVNFDGGKGIEHITRMFWGNEVDQALGYVLKNRRLGNPIKGNLTTHNTKLKGSLLHAFGADKSGSFADIQRGGFSGKPDSVYSGVAKVFDLIDTVDPNKNLQDLFHDVTLVASANSWKKANKNKLKGLPDPVDNWFDFESKAPKELVADFLMKKNVDMGLIAGTGGKGTTFTMSGIGTNQVGKAMTTFMSPVFRIANNYRRAWGEMADSLVFENGKFKTVDSDRFLKGFAGVTQQTVLTFLVAGKAGIYGLPVVGPLINFTMNALPPEKREEFEKEMDKLISMNNYMHWGEKFQVQGRSVGTNSLLGAIKSRLTQAGNGAAGSLLESYSSMLEELNRLGEKHQKGELTDSELRKKRAVAFTKVMPYGVAINKVIKFVDDDATKAIGERSGNRFMKYGEVKTKGSWKILFGGKTDEELKIIKQHEQKQEAKKAIVSERFNFIPVRSGNKVVYKPNLTEAQEKKLNEVALMRAKETGEDPKKVRAKLINNARDNYKARKDAELRAKKPSNNLIKKDVA